MFQSDKDPDFFELHPHAMNNGVNRLYRYQPILTAQAKAVPELKTIATNRLHELLVGQWLYHSKPNQLNDPFEAKPHFRWPSNPEDTVALRDHLGRIQKERGQSYKQRRANVSRIMANHREAEELLKEGLHQSFSELRLSCFTQLENDLLFWSHYADSHRGVCFEFDASKAPIGLAYKVKYDEAYPTAKIPPSSVEDALRPVLTKSPDWEREREYRSLLISENDSQHITLNKDGTHLLVPPDALTGVYFGALAEDEDKDLVMTLIDKGPFNPTIYHGEQSADSFKVLFRK